MEIKVDGMHDIDPIITSTLNLILSNIILIYLSSLTSKLNKVLEEC